MLPTATAVARPWLPAALETVATPAWPVAQTTAVVRSAVPPSASTPVAVYACVPPRVTRASSGVTRMSVSAAFTTVSRPVPDTPARVAVTVAWPALWPSAWPGPFTLTTLCGETLHATSPVTSALEPSA